MRLLCLADLQIGVGADFGRAPYGPGSRLDDQEKMLLVIAELAEREGVDEIVIAGDVFHRRPYPRSEELLVLGRFLTRLKMPVRAIVGNHDIVSDSAPCALDLFDELDLLDLHRQPFAMPALGLAFLPWVPAARLIAARDGGSREERNRELAALLVTIARGLAQDLDASQPRVLIAHWAVSGAALPTGLPTDRLGETVIPIAEISECGFDAVILGHIHKQQVLLDHSPLVFYAGSPWNCDFSETQIEHGVWLLDTIPQLSWRFIPIEDRPFITLDYDLTARQTFDDWPVLDGAVVRLRYRCSEEQARWINRAKIERALLDANAHTVYQITAEVERAQRARAEGLDETMDPLEALEFALARDEEAGAYTDEVRDLTERYLHEAVA